MRRIVPARASCNSDSPSRDLSPAPLVIPWHNLITLDVRDGLSRVERHAADRYAAEHGHPATAKAIERWVWARSRSLTPDEFVHHRPYPTWHPLLRRSFVDILDPELDHFATEEAFTAALRREDAQVANDVAAMAWKPGDPPRPPGATTTDQMVERLRYIRPWLPKRERAKLLGLIARTCRCRFHTINPRRFAEGDDGRELVWSPAEVEIRKRKRARCKSPLCPGCLAERGKAHHKRLAGHMQDADPKTLFMLRVEVVTDNPAEGHAALSRLCRRLHESAAWKRIVESGFYHFEIARGVEAGKLTWNVHRHYVLAIRDVRDAAELRSAVEDFQARHTAIGMNIAEPYFETIRDVEKAATYVTSEPTRRWVGEPDWTPEMRRMSECEGETMPLDDDGFLTWIEFWLAARVHRWSFLRGWR